MIVRIEKPGYTGPNAEQAAAAAGTSAAAVDVGGDEDLNAGDDPAGSGETAADRAQLSVPA